MMMITAGIRGNLCCWWIAFGGMTESRAQSLLFITTNNFQHIYDYTLDKLCRHKKGNCCQKLGIRWLADQRQPHAIPRLAPAPSVPVSLF